MIMARARRCSISFRDRGRITFDTRGLGFRFDSHLTSLRPALATHADGDQVKRERDAKLMDLHSGTPWETLTLTTLSASRHLFAQLLTDARSLAEASTEGKTVVYTAWGVEWRPFGKPRRRREMGSVVLAEGVAERVEHDLRGFLGRAKWYAERGMISR
jgi:hypothetical protein